MAAGLLSGVFVAVLPGAIGVIAVLGAAFAAGWLLPTAPMKAAALFVLPAVLFGVAVSLLDGQLDTAGAYLIGAVIALVVAAIFTHLGAGVALRRGRP